MSATLYREAATWFGSTENDMKAEAMLEQLTEWGWLEPVEIDDETARNAYINARIVVEGSKFITGTSMEPHDEAAFVLSMVRDAIFGSGDN